MSEPVKFGKAMPWGFHICLECGNEWFEGYWQKENIPKCTNCDTEIGLEITVIEE